MKKTDYSIKIAQQLIKQIDDLSSVESYSENRSARQNLASLYKQVMNVGSSFPKRESTMTNYTPAQLNKKTSRTCPSCVHPERMKIYVREAITSLERYAEVLKKWLSDDLSEQDETEQKEKTIHDLRPNID